MPATPQSARQTASGASSDSAADTQSAQLVETDAARQTTATDEPVATQSGAAAEAALKSDAAPGPQAPSTQAAANDIAQLVALAAAQRASAMQQRRAEIAAAAEKKHHLQAGVAVPKDYVPSAESAHTLYQLEIDGFEGPLDLLLLLIKRHQLDIFNIPMGFICARYLETLAAIEQLNIDVAAEFLSMAAELVHIKSRLLLPDDKAATDAAEEDDPRAALVARLLEYQTYKDAANQLHQLPHLNRDVFERAPEALPPSQAKQTLREASVYSLVQAFGAVLKRQKPEVRHRVTVESVSMRQRMMFLIESLTDSQAVLFVSLLEGIERRLDVVVTFLAVLEMTRLKLLRIYESDAGALYLHPRFEHREMAIGRIAGVDEHQYAG